MRKIFILAAGVGIMLSGCSPSNIEKAQKAAELVKQNCGVIVRIADIAAAFSAANPVVTTAAAMANAICSQAERTENGALQHYSGIVLAQVEQPEPPPLPNPKPPVDEEAQPEPEPVPLPEPEPAYDCVAVVNGVCIRKEVK